MKFFIFPSAILSEHYCLNQTNQLITYTIFCLKIKTCSSANLLNAVNKTLSVTFDFIFAKNGRELNWIL